MRSTVWFGLAFAVAACGKSERNGDGEHQGGGGGAAAAASGGSSGAPSASGSTGASASGSSGAPAGGAASPPGGTSNGTGGRGAAGLGASGGLEAGADTGGGGAGTSASAGDGGFGAGGVGGEAGSAGAGGGPPLECAGEYDACGCGCCGGTTPRAVCYYPDRGDSLETIKSDDLSAAASPSCAAAGCSLGLHYVCCTPPNEPPPEKSYETTGGMVGTELYRVSLRRHGEDERCQFVHIARGDGPGGTEFPIALPSGWILETLTDYACEDEISANASTRRSAIGGFGSLSFAKSSDDCTVKFDFTLFFESSVGSIDAVRFRSEGEPSPIVPECE